MVDAFARGALGLLNKMSHAVAAISSTQPISVRTTG